jgi:DNA-binding response OmpR family regulator
VTARPSGAAPHAPPAEILVAEDDPVAARVLRPMLEHVGHRVTVAGDGESALRLLEEGAPDLLLLDWMLPGMTGLEVCHRARQRWDALRLPILMVTARTDADSIYAAFDAGASDYIAKPFRGAELRARVSAHLGMRRLAEERARMEEHLREREKLFTLGLLAGGIAHDLNNPLASVVGFADFLTEIPNVPPSIREPLTVVREEAERASSIVRNLLGFARKQEHQRRPTALKPLLDATFVLLRNQLMAQRVEAQVEIEPDLPMPDIDPNQIQQVFVNLINNAAQAIASTGRTGNILVRVRRWLDGVAIDVIDDGPGMSETLATQVFEPFFTTKAEGEGTGLGLSISQGIVKEHGGRIMLSTEEGRGSTFTVQLPLSTRTEAPPADLGAQAPTTRLRVLVVDDEPHILHYMRATLEAWGHIPVVASDGQEALARATREHFDLIISDLRMPRFGGREFYEELSRHDPGMAARLVFSTGDTVRGDTLTFLETLDRPYLHKPFSLAELRTLLADVVRESGSAAPQRETRAFPADVLPGT